jgi:hypothetical protein
MMLTAYAFEKLIKPFGQFSFWLSAEVQAMPPVRPLYPQQPTFERRSPFSP